MESASFLSKFFWDRFGLAWAFYFLWLKHWPEAIAMAGMFFVMGTLTAWMMDLNVFSSPRVDGYFRQIWPLKRVLIRWFGYTTAGYFLYEHFLPGATVSFGVVFAGHLPASWSEQLYATANKNIHQSLVLMRAGLISFYDNVNARKNGIEARFRKLP